MDAFPVHVVYGVTTTTTYTNPVSYTHLDVYKRQPICRQSIIVRENRYIFYNCTDIHVTIYYLRYNIG